MPSPLGLIRQALPAALGTLATVSVVSWMLYYRYRRQDVYCDVCDMWLSSQGQYEDHLTGKKHKKNDPSRTRRPRRQAGQRSRLWGLEAETQADNEDWLCFISDCEDGEEL